MKAKILDNSDVTITTNDEVIFHEEVEGEAQERFICSGQTKITTFAIKRSFCNKDREPWN